MIDLILALALAAQPPPKPPKPSDDRRDASTRILAEASAGTDQTTDRTNR